MSKPEIKSWKNLEAAFAGESMAFQKYMYFAKIARKNGDEQVAKLFEETAKHETKHAEGHLRHLYPFNKMTTEQVLKIAVEGEKFEYTEMYPQYAKIAEEEGMADWLVQEFQDGIGECKEHAEVFQEKLKKLNKVFTGLSKVEKEHHDNYALALKDFKATQTGSFDQSELFLEDFAPEKLS